MALPAKCASSRHYALRSLFRVLAPCLVPHLRSEHIVRDSHLLSFTSDIVVKREGLRPARICIPITDDAAHVTYYAALLTKNLPKLQPLVTALEAKAQRLKAAQSIAAPLLA